MELISRCMMRRMTTLLIISVVLLAVLEIPLLSRMFYKNEDFGTKRIESGSRRSELAGQHLADGLDPDVKDVSTQLVKEDETDTKTQTKRLLKIVSGFGTDIILFSAIAGNSTSNSTWDKIAIAAWEAIRLENQTYVCCVAYASGVIKPFPAEKISRGSKSRLKSRQYICALEEPSLTDLPVAATIADANKPTCHKVTAYYVEVDYAYAHPDEVAAYGKVIYGNVSAHDILAWVEMHRAQGVTKFLVYPYEVPDDVMKVLQYYERQDLLEYIPLTRHTTGPFKAVGGNQYHNDQEVTEYDALQRLRGYKYMVNFDIDEYILSRKGETWIQIFDRLFYQHPDAGAFWFQSYIFVKSWVATNAKFRFTVARYLMRTNITWDTRKLVVDPSKVKDIGLSTHFTLLKPGYKTHMVNHEEAAIHHYRECRKKWLPKNADFPCYNVTRFYDETVMNIFKKIDKRVFDIVKKLGI